MKKIIIITGLTGSGKSSIALDLARKYNGEIISADSVQVYKHLNIGSAKDTEAMKIVPHHVIDFLDPKMKYNVGEFIADTKVALDSILVKGKLPIIVGGTAMYIKALIEGYSLGDKADLEFRQKYNDLAKEKGNMFVWEELNKLNPDKAKTVHPNNLKRVIRYLELEKCGAVADIEPSILTGYDVLTIGVVANREDIYARINSRVDEMLADGLESEVRHLVDLGVTREDQCVNSIGYKEWFDYFEGKTDYETTVNLIKQHTRNYCKRQLTFLKTMKSVEMLTKTEAKKRIEEFLND